MITIFWPEKEAADIAEVKFSYDFCRKVCKDLMASWCRELVWVDYSGGLTLKDALSAVKGDFLLVVTDPEILMASEAVEQMIRACKNEASACVPVFNTTAFPEQAADLPAIYLNVTSYLEVAGIIAGDENRQIQPVANHDPAVVLYHKRLFDRKGLFDRRRPMDLGVELSRLNHELPESLREKIRVNKGAFVHAFGDYYGAQRDDLVQLIPDGVKNVLDVGCAMGFYGKRLKQERPEIRLTGIEMNPHMAAMAKAHYDKVMVAKIEDVDIEERFDLVNCGDIIEHLYDPWDMLKRLVIYLKTGGHFVVSIPNAGHWTIVKDLMKGKFQYIPVGPLCMSHIRWFTEASLIEALSEVGLKVEMINYQKFPPTPAGAKFIDDVCALGLGDRNSLETNQFTLRAVKV
ncbi:MAG: class I SAM-dependent methyltransferase [Desulfobacterium sp.]|nr:class I SAM-dependent methyltransferase [Desulfobacterium sp.]